MNIIKNIIFISLLTFIYPFNQVDGYDVTENAIVIKFEENFSPKLGSKNSIRIDQLQSLSDRFKNLDIIEFKPVFFETQDFKEREYKYSLHQYYLLIHYKYMLQL